MEQNTTSEVGCNPVNLEDVENGMENESVSNIGASEDHGSDKWQAILAMQNKNFMELIKLVKNDKTTSNESKSITLPKFNPDLLGSDAASWCSTVEFILTEKPLTGSSLIMTLSNCLLGSASQWLSSICFPGITWSEFKDLFVQRFACIETPAALLSNLLKSQPKREEGLSVFGSRFVTSLLSSWKDLNKEEIAVSLTLARMAQIDDRLQRSLFTTKISTRNELQQELKAFAHMKFGERRDEYVSIHSDAKRIKLNSNWKCHFCGKAGHKIADCRSRSIKTDSQDSGTSFKRESKTITCYKCGQDGHIASRCPSKGGMMQVSSNKQKMASEKSVNICSIEPKGTLVQSGESYQFYFDSGAECSLLKESISLKFSGKRIDTLVTLRGIGNAIIHSTLKIISEVKINNSIIEIEFYVVSDKDLKHSIIVGREILQLGFEVRMTSNDFEISRSKSVQICSNIPDSFSVDKISTELIGEDKSKLVSLLSTYRDNFIEGFPRTSITSGQLQIRLINPNKTVQRRPYRLSPEERQTVRTKIKELLDAKIIRPSTSPYASPILLVKKKDGTDRMCIDYRELNANTVADKYPLPIISDQIARLRGAKYFTSLDMASGYHQIAIHPDSIEITAFVTPDGHFEYLKVPFGLRNAPAVFQRAVMNALGDLVHSFVVVYMDDILIISNTKEEAFQRLEIVLNVLAKAGFSFNIKKCSFLQSCIQYLGYEVSAGEIRPNPRKIKALTELAPPQSVHQLRQFIGLASYFRQFVHKFSQLMRPLYLLTTDKSFVWTTEHEQIRLKIISILTNEPLLTIFDPKYPIELHTDASSKGYGAVLLHKINNKSHVVEYFSKRTTDAESRYHSYELETLAVVNAIKHFRHYLQGHKFVVFTDCDSLKATLTKLNLSPKVHRWWAFLQAFDFDIQYCEGKRMSHVDFLSRNHPPIKEHTYTKIDDKRVEMAEITDNWLLAEQQRDDEISSVVQKLNSGDLSQGSTKTYEIRKGILYRKVQRFGKTLCLPVVPRAFRWSVISNVHEAVIHLGWKKTLDKVYDYFWFPRMAKYVRKFVGNCITCNMAKPPSGKVPMELHPIPKVSVPWHTLHIDITGKLSGKNELKEYIIVIVDAFTKYVLLYHTMNIDAKNCVDALRWAISIFGVPSRVIADQGRCFAGNQFANFCSLQNIRLHLIATGASRANGQVERVMSTLKSMLTAVEMSKRSWQDALGEVQLALNCTTNRVTNASPLELLIGKIVKPLGLSAIGEIESNVDVSQIRSDAENRMRQNAAYDKEAFDSNKAKIVSFKVGDFVLIRNEERHQTKLEPKYKGPFLVTEILDGDRYNLKSINSKRTYKYSHEKLRKLPSGKVPEELDIEVEEGSSDESEVTVE